MTTQTPTAAHAAARLDAFAAHLLTQPDLDATLTPSGLRIRTDTPGCCSEVRQRGDLITCRRREDDRNELWFWTSWGDPIAPAHDVIGASVRVRGYLAVES